MTTNSTSRTGTTDSTTAPARTASGGTRRPTQDRSPAGYLRTVVDHLRHPAPAGAGRLRRQLRLACQALAVVSVVATVVQIAIWLLVAIFSGHLEFPWWLWTLLTGAVLVGAVAGVEHTVAADEEQAL